MWLQKVDMRGRLVPILLVMAVFLQGCLKSEEEAYDGYKYLLEDIQTIQNYLEANNIDAEMDSTDGYFYTIHKRGEGYRTISGAEVSAHYQGLTLDGDEFATTYAGSPTEFVLANSDTYTAAMTVGVAIGVSVMHVGDSATIYLPSPYGFQDQSYQNVPPNSVLVYNVKFTDIKGLDAENVKIDEYITVNSMTAEIDSVFGTRYVIHRIGNGISPNFGAQISTHYQGELLDGTVFDESYTSNRPLDFTYGDGSLIPGFEMGVKHLHENDSATIFIPSIYGYKDVAKENIPANSVLAFGLEILRISNIN